MKICDLFDSTPSRPHKKCDKPASGKLRNAMTGEEKEGCKKHLLMLDGFGAWREVTK